RRLMLFIGQASLSGDITRYAQNFNLVELLAEPGRLPKAAGLRKWASSVESEFAFSLRVSGRLWGADAEASAQMVDYVSQVDEILKPKVCLLQTPATATPTTRNRQKLRTLCEQLRQPNAKMAWEPRGVWEPLELTSLSNDLGVLLVRDLSRQEEAPEGDAVYTRLLALGEATHVKSGAAEEVAEKV